MLDKHKLYDTLISIIEYHEKGVIKCLEDVRVAVETKFEDVATGGEMDEIAFHLWEVLQQMYYLGKN